MELIVRPMISDFCDEIQASRNGKAIITGTPKGKNQLHAFYDRGDDPKFPEWSSILMTYLDTGALDPKEIESIRLETVEEAFEQEYLCSFQAAIRGAYFGKNIAKLKSSDRIGMFDHDPAYPVVTGWDIGFDGTVIWYCQKIGERVRLIDIDCFEGKDLPYCAGKVLNKPYTYEKQLLPHDGKKRSWLDKKKTAKGQLELLGLKVKLVKRGSFEDGIHATRNFIDSVVFSEKKCDRKIRLGKTEISPLDALSLYSAKVDEDGMMQENAQKKYSHIADGLRTLSMGLKDSNITGVKTLHSRHRPNNMQQGLIKNEWDPFTIYN